MFQETQPTQLDSNPHWLLLNSLMPTTQLLIAVFNSVLPITELISSQVPLHVLLAALASSITLLKDVVSVKLVIIPFSKLVGKVLEALNAIPALHPFAKHVFKLPQLNVIVASTVLLLTVMETVLASLAITKTVLFALLAQLSVLLVELEEYAILVLILPLEA